MMVNDDLEFINYELCMIEKQIVVKIKTYL